MFKNLNAEVFIFIFTNSGNIQAADFQRLSQLISIVLVRG